MKGSILSFIAWTFIFTAEAQVDRHEYESLIQSLRTAPQDTLRMTAYYDLGWFFIESNHDSALYYLDKGLPIAQKLGLKLNESNYLDLKGYIFSKIGNYPKSLELYLLSFKIMDDPKNEGKIWPRRNARMEKIAWFYHNIGWVYEKTGNIEKALSSYFKSIEIAKTINIPELNANNHWTIGDAYIQLGKLDSAIFYLQKALDFFSNSNTRFWSRYEGNVLKSIGEIYLKKGEFNLSQSTLLKSVQVNEDKNNFIYKGDTYLLLAQLFQTIHKPDTTLFYAKRSLESYKLVRNAFGIASAWSLLSTVYEIQNNKDSAFTYLKLAKALQDSLNRVKIKNLMDYQNVGFNDQQQLEKLEKEKIETKTKIRTYAMASGLTILILISFVLYRNNKYRQKTNSQLQLQKEELQSTLNELKSTQSQLIQTEKMASLGELTAGIAHEIQNPLNFVNNFSSINAELINEMKDEIDKGNIAEVKVLADDIKENEGKIIHHGQRAESIVKNMLQHSRNSTGVKEPTDINALANEYMRLSYHGLRAKDKTFNAVPIAIGMKMNPDPSLPLINVIPQDIGRVFLNLFNNAFWACAERGRLEVPSYSGGNRKSENANFDLLSPISGLPSSLPPFLPLVILTTKNLQSKIEIRIHDNGPGISPSIKDKIFQPFFTTKPTGQGTGLGLSLAYDIIKAHQGTIKVNSEENKFTEFIIELPVAHN